MNFQKITEQVKKIHKARKELVEEVRVYVKQQKDLWQKIPYLALHADGRSGYSDQYSDAYNHGIWTLRSATYTIHIDLETGGLKGSADEILKAVISNPQEFDAAQTIKTLERKCEEPIDSYYKADDRREREEHIRSILQRGEITRTSYRRNED